MSLNLQEAMRASLGIESNDVEDVVDAEVETTEGETEEVTEDISEEAEVVEEAGDMVDELAGKLDEVEETVEELQELHESLESAVLTGGLNPQAAQFVKLSLENYARRYNLDTDTLTVGLEDHADDPELATQVSMEKVGEMIAGLKENVTAIISGVVATVGEFYTNLPALLDKLKGRIAAVKDKARSITAKGSNVKVGGSEFLTATGGSVDAGSYTKDLGYTAGVLNNVLTSTDKAKIADFAVEAIAAVAQGNEKLDAYYINGVAGKERDNTVDFKKFADMIKSTGDFKNAVTNKNVHPRGNVDGDVYSVKSTDTLLGGVVGYQSQIQEQFVNKMIAGIAEGKENALKFSTERHLVYKAASYVGAAILLSVGLGFAATVAFAGGAAGGAAIATGVAAANSGAAGAGGLVAGGIGKAVAGTIAGTLLSTGTVKLVRASLKHDMDLIKEVRSLSAAEVVGCSRHVGIAKTVKAKAGEIEALDSASAQKVVAQLESLQATLAQAAKDHAALGKLVKEMNKANLKRKNMKKELASVSSVFSYQIAELLRGEAQFAKHGLKVVKAGLRYVEASAGVTSPAEA